jgi:hypothetical protein
MSTFDDREKGFERKFALDQEQMFRAHARRDKLFGLWAAGRMGLSGAAAEDYAKGIVSEDIAHPGDKAIAHKVAADLAAKGIKTPEAELSSKLDELFAAAKQQIAAEAAK